MIVNVFQVFSEIAARLVSEGADKTWDQCRIKLKNLKSQYRYVKERIPYIDDLDLDNEDVIKQLLTECQAKAISPSSIKHLKFLLRYGERSFTFKNLLNSIRSKSVKVGLSPIRIFSTIIMNVKLSQPKCFHTALLEFPNHSQEFPPIYLLII